MVSCKPTTITFNFATFEFMSLRNQSLKIASFVRNSPDLIGTCILFKLRVVCNILILLTTILISVFLAFKNAH